MGTAIVVTFRESLEALLLVAPLLIYLHKIDKHELKKYIYLGIFLGLFLGIVCGSLLIGQINHLTEQMQQIFRGVMLIFLALLVLYNIIYIFKNDKSFSLNKEIDFNLELKWTSLFLIAFLNVFRESLEIIVFVVPLTINIPFNMIVSIIVGLSLSVALTLLLFKTSIKLNVNILFNILNLILIFIGGELLGEGLECIFTSKENVELLGRLIFTVPLLFIFLKRNIKKYLRRM